MLPREPDFQFLRKNLADALLRRDIKEGKSIETIEQEREKAINYQMKYPMLAKKSYETMMASQASSNSC